MSCDSQSRDSVCLITCTQCWGACSTSCSIIREGERKRAWTDLFGWWRGHYLFGSFLFNSITKCRTLENRATMNWSTGERERGEGEERVGEKVRKDKKGLLNNKSNMPV